MKYQVEHEYNQAPGLIYLQLIAALIGSLLTAVQTLLIVIQGDILCLNEGCEVVERLTAVPPIFFNLAGFLYFLAILVSVWRGRKGSMVWRNLACLLALAGMAAEGVLVGFQHYVAQTFCSYCLIVLTLIVFINLVLGIRQLATALTVFAAVILAFSSLIFTPQSEGGGVVLEDGVLGYVGESGSTDQHYLFFSSSCPHCEEVIETLDEGLNCNLSFSPIDTISGFDVSGFVPSSGYDPGINRRYLTKFGIAEIPVLAVESDSEIRIIKGKTRIMEYLAENCRSVAESADNIEGFSEMSSQEPVLPYYSQPAAEEGCAVEEDCEEPSGQIKKE